MARCAQRQGDLAAAQEAWRRVVAASTGRRGDALTLLAVIACRALALDAEAQVLLQRWGSSAMPADPVWCWAQAWLAGDHVHAHALLDDPPGQRLRSWWRSTGSDGNLAPVWCIVESLEQ
jgi:hypothetical protein